MFGPEILTKTYRYALRPTPAQISAFCQISGCCRLVYNWGLEQRRAHDASAPVDEDGKLVRLKVNDQINGLPKLKKIKTFLADAPAQTLQAALRDLDDAVQRRASGQNEAPTFRRKGEPEAFRFPQPEQFAIAKIPHEIRKAGSLLACGAARNKAKYLRAPKFGMKATDAGPIEMIVHRPIKGRIKSCTIRREGDIWYACFVTEIRRRGRTDNPKIAATERMIATDPTLGEQPRKPKPKACKIEKARHRARANERRAKRSRSRKEQNAIVAARAKALPKLDWTDLDGLRVLGIDRNTRNPFATSDGDIFGALVMSPDDKRRLKRLQRAVSRKEEALRARHGREPGSSLRGLSVSNALRKARHRVRSFHARIARKRTDMIHKITAWLVEQADIFVIEDLQTQGMTASAAGTIEEPGSNVAQKSGLNASILDKGWGEFVRQLDYKCRWASRRGGAKKILVRVNPAYTSQRCFSCKEVDSDSRDTDLYHCTSCGHEDQADLNAAKNIRELGLEDLARACAMVLEDLPEDLRRLQRQEISNQDETAGGSPVEASEGIGRWAPEPQVLGMRKKREPSGRLHLFQASASGSAAAPN